MKSIIFVFFILLFGITGCPADEESNRNEGSYAKYYKGDFRDNQNGTVEVINNTDYDMLLFSGGIINEPYIVGGVKSHTTIFVNFSNESDFRIGGFAILQGVKQGEFDVYKASSKVDWGAMVPYGEGKKFLTKIFTTTVGDYQFTVTNRSNDYALELRKNSPEGEIVAFLSRGEYRKVIKCASSEELTLFPVWVAFNDITKSLVTFSPSILAALTITPCLPSEASSQYFFPAGASTNINFSEIQIPFSLINVINNTGSSAILRNGNSVIIAISGYTDITSGSREIYEILSEGLDLNLNISLLQGSMMIPVKFEDNPSVSSVTLESGYIYNVTLTLKLGADPGQVSSYEAWLVKYGMINIQDFLISY